MTRPIVWVQWRDAHDIDSGSWASFAPVVECLIDSVGFLLWEDDIWLVLVQSESHDEDTLLRGQFAIPKVGIVQEFRTPDSTTRKEQ